MSTGESTPKNILTIADDIRIIFRPERNIMKTDENHQPA